MLWTPAFSSNHSLQVLMVSLLLIICHQPNTIAYVPSTSSRLSIQNETPRPTTSPRTTGPSSPPLIQSYSMKSSYSKPQNDLLVRPMSSTMEQPSSPSSSLESVRKFIQKNFFVLGMGVGVALAKAFPQLGVDGGILRPELLIGKYGVMMIFFISGLSLELSDLKEAAFHHRLNVLTQLASFGAWPLLIGLPLVKFLRTCLPGLLPEPLLDGLLILTTLPTTVNMCIFLTTAAGGNVASSLCNAVFGNLLGIFITPAILLRFFGKSIELPFMTMISKLCFKVLFPVALGQCLRFTVMKDVYTRHSPKFKKLQEIVLLGIVWNAFCNAFTKGLGIDLRNGLALLFIVPSLHIFSMVALFKFFQIKWLRFTREEVVAAMFCASHKTLAFGLPLVNTIFEGHKNLAAYCAPIMFVHPMQLLIGSLLVPWLQKFIRGEEEKKKDLGKVA